jgi:hypothetical protein
MIWPRTTAACEGIAVNDSPNAVAGPSILRFSALNFFHTTHWIVEAWSVLESSRRLCIHGSAYSPERVGVELYHDWRGGVDCKVRNSL